MGVHGDSALFTAMVASGLEIIRIVFEYSNLHLEFRINGFGMPDFKSIGLKIFFFGSIL